MTKKSVLETSNSINIPFRIDSKPTYYTVNDYLLSIPAIISLFYNLYLLSSTPCRFVFHGFPFQILLPFVSPLFKNRDVQLCYVFHQYKKLPASFFGTISSSIERFILSLDSRVNFYGVSPWVLSRVKNLFPSIASRTQLITIPVELAAVNNSQTSLSSSSIINYVKSCGPYLIYGARIIPQKGHLYLLKLLSECQSPSRLKVKTIVFAGSGSEQYINQLKDYASKFLPFLRLVFTGSLPKESYIQLLIDSEAFVFPSFREAFPLSLLEASSYGKPLFILKDYLIKHYEGLSFPLTDVIRYMEHPSLTNTVSIDNKPKPGIIEKHLLVSDFSSSLRLPFK